MVRDNPIIMVLRRKKSMTLFRLSYVPELNRI